VRSFLFVSFAFSNLKRALIIFVEHQRHDELSREDDKQTKGHACRNNRTKLKVGDDQSCFRDRSMGCEKVGQ
jgi:hypothetical protein